ncbi:MAG: hypothetical protein ACKVTZ_07255 [Bacteroidia bacterium]
MKLFDANLPQNVLAFLAEKLAHTTCFETANKEIHAHFGILSFFENSEELATLKKATLDIKNRVEEPDRTAYGDFQTNINLANNCVSYLLTKTVSPQIIIEPTCGKGNFILACLSHFAEVEYIIGVEIYKPYIWETKFQIIQFYLENQRGNKPNILISHNNVFDFDFAAIAKLYSEKEILVIGNPPWVTNAQLGTLNSKNLPAKTNFKKHKGLDALTGKGNFDIAEAISFVMLNTFQKTNCHLVLLVKNSVIKNMVFDQQQHHFALSEIEKLSIDSRKEFKVFVEAALFYGKLNGRPSYICKEINFYDKHKTVKNKYGWLEKKFVSNLDAYVGSQEIEGKSPFEWRQGLKHDCAVIMELLKEEEHYVNGLNEKVELEDDLVYALLKSSDLKGGLIRQTRKVTIVPQKKIGEPTDDIPSKYPQTSHYLRRHLAHFEARKSAIYKNKPPFSIFGIGDYSFKPYKVAISGLYKTFHFTFILPQNHKPIMLDDTCYFLGFDRIEFAAYTFLLLNSEKTTQFLTAITFADAKRTFTKEVLMRIDMGALAKLYAPDYVQNELDKLNEKYGLNLTLDLWAAFLHEITPLHKTQILMFE